MEKLCPNCKRGIYMNFDLHVIHCTRKYKLCTVCDEVVAISELDEHLKSHGTVECPVCKKDVERKDMQMHEETACTPRMSVECEFCHLHIPLLEYQKHLHYCGSRTEQCYVCGARVTLNDLEVHLRGHASTREVIGGSSGSRTPTNVPTLARRPESISEFARSAMAAAADADGFGIEFGGAGRNTPSPVPRPWTPQSPQSPLGSPTRNEIPGDVYFSPEPGAMGDLADTIPCDICLLNVPFHLYQEHALACQPADDNPYITGMSMGSAMNRSPPPGASSRPRSPSPAPSPPMDMEPEPGPSGQRRYNEPMPGPSVQQRRKIPYGPLAGSTGFLEFNSPRPRPTGFLGFNSPEPRPPGSSGFINPRPRLSAFVEFNNAQPGPSGLQDFDNPQPGPSGLSTRPRPAPFRSFERTYDSSSDDDVQTIPCDICHRHVEEHVYARHLKECKDRKVRRVQQGHNNDEDVWAMEHGACDQNGRGVDPNTPIPCDACGEIIPLDAYLDHALHAHSNHRMWNPNEAVPFPPDAFPTRDHYRRSSSFDQAERRSSMSPQRRTGTKRDSRSRETSGSGNELVVIDSDEEEQPKKKRSYVPTRNTVVPPRPRATSDTRPTNGLLASLPLPPLNPKPEKPYYEIPEWIIHGAHGTIKRDLLRLSGKLNRETDCPDTGNKNEIAYRTRAFTLISARAQVAARIVALGLRATGDEELRKRLKDDIVAGRSHESAARELCALNRWSEPRYESRLADDGTIVVTAIVNLLPAQGGRRIHPQSAVAEPASVMAGSSRREPAPAEAQAAITAPAQTSAPVSARAAVPHRSTASLPAQAAAAVAVQAHAAIPVQDFAAIPAPIAAMVQIPSTPGNTNDARPRASSSAAAGTSNGNKKVENKPQQQPRRSIRANIPGRGVSASQTCRRASDRIRDRKQHRADNEAEEQGQADGDRGRGRGHGHGHGHGHGRGGQGQGRGGGGGRGRGGRGRGAHNGATPKTPQDPRRSL